MVGNCDSNDFIIEANGTIVKKAPIGTTLINGITSVMGGETDSGTRPPIGPPGGKPEPVLDNEEGVVDGDGRGGPRAKPPVHTDNISYVCVGGVCFPYEGGPHDGPIYSSLEACDAKCAKTTPPPPDTPSGEEDDRGGALDITDERDGPTMYEDKKDAPVGMDLLGATKERDADKLGICKSGYYWCESLGKCISLKEPCK